NFVCIVPCRGHRYGRLPVAIVSPDFCHGGENRRQTPRLCYIRPVIRHVSLFKNLGKLSAFIFGQMADPVACRYRTVMFPIVFRIARKVWYNIAEMSELMTEPQQGAF